MAQGSVSGQFAGERDIWPGERTTDLADLPPLRNEWTSTEKSPKSHGHPHKLLSLEFLPNLTPVTQSDSMVHTEERGTRRHGFQSQL